MTKVKSQHNRQLPSARLPSSHEFVTLMHDGEMVAHLMHWCSIDYIYDHCYDHRHMRQVIVIPHHII